MKHLLVDIEPSPHIIPLLIIIISTNSLHLPKILGHAVYRDHLPLKALFIWVNIAPHCNGAFLSVFQRSREGYREGKPLCMSLKCMHTWVPVYVCVYRAHMRLKKSRVCCMCKIQELRCVHGAYTQRRKLHVSVGAQVCACVNVRIHSCI